MADPIKENLFQELAWHREEGNPSVVVTLLGVTLSLPDRNDNAPSPVGRDNLRVPNGTQQSVQPQKSSGFPRLEHLSVDAAPSRSFPFFRWFTTLLVSSSVGGSQLTGVRILDPCKLGPAGLALSLEDLDSDRRA